MAARVRNLSRQSKSVQGPTKVAFTLTRLRGRIIERLIRDQRAAFLTRLGILHPDLVKVAKRLPAKLLLSVMGSELPLTSSGISVKPTKGLIQFLRYFAARPEAITIGIWELDNPVVGLAETLADLNRAQRHFSFLRVKASVPAGLVSKVERLRWFFDQDAGFGKDAYAPEDPNVMAEDFQSLSDDVRTDVGLEYLIGITGFGVASDDKDDGFEFDITSVTRKKCTIVSTYWLRQEASKHRLSLSALTAWTILGQILVDLSRRLAFHADRGCLFDENQDDFETLGPALVDGAVEEACAVLIRRDLREATAVSVNLLAEKARVAPVVRKGRRRTTTPRSAKRVTRAAQRRAKKKV
jgi:hypothetical protein